MNLKSKPIFDIEDHLKYTKDWRGQYIGDAIAILKPHDKYEVSKILKFANDNEISIVPQGEIQAFAVVQLLLKILFQLL